MIPESEYEDWICDNIEQLVPGGRVVGRQMTLPGDGGRLDVLAVSIGAPGFGHNAICFTVIEVKRDKVDAAAVMQIQRYIGSLRECVGQRFEVRGRPVGFMGILAAPGITNEALTILRAALTVSYCQVTATVEFDAALWDLSQSKRGDHEKYAASGVSGMLDGFGVELLEELEWWDEVTASDEQP